MDGNEELVAFAKKLEAAALRTVEDGIMTKDLFLLSELPGKQSVCTETFVKEIRARLEQ
jgi:isocitrate dehydrogenase